MSLQVFIDAPKLVEPFMAAELPIKGVFRCIGFFRKGQIFCGAIYNNYYGFDAQITVVCTHPEWITRGVLKAMCELPFKAMGCRRLSAYIARKNKHAREVAQRFGFKLEGTIRHGFDGVQDCMVYGMLREECRWINGN